MKLIKFAEQTLIRLIGRERILPMQIDITNLCNLKCAHCYHPHHKNQDALSTSDWISVLNQYDELLDRVLCQPQLEICGGEPLLSPLLKPILGYVAANKRPYHISILTNGTLVKHFDFNLLKGIEDVTFQISLDGPNATLHDEIRGKSSFDRALEGIQLIQGAGYKVDILCVLSKRSSKYIPSLFDLAKSLNVHALGFTRLIANGHANNLLADNIDRPLFPLELKNAYEQILIHSARTRIPSSTQKNLFHLIHPRLGRSGRFAEGLVVDYQGNILASSRSRIVLGHVHREGLAEILFSHPILKAIRRGKVDVCGRCRHYSRCGGDRNAAYAHSGNYLGADPGCWLTTNQDELIPDNKGSAV